MTSIPPIGQTLNEQTFNDDLLMNKSDLDFAKSQFPEIIHALDYPRLRAKFAEYEKLANSARDHVRRLGAATLVFATLALLALVTHPLWPHGVWTPRIGLLLELGGLFAALIAANGMWLGPWKRRWLESRLMTERLRQWHFQLLVRKGKEIEASCVNQNSQSAFSQQRDLWFEQFLKSHEGKLIAQLESLTGEHTDFEIWLHSPQTSYNSGSIVFDKVCEAFKPLRFAHQHSYTVYKSRSTSNEPFWKFLKWPARRQLRILSGIIASSFICTLVASCVLIYDHSVTLLRFDSLELSSAVQILWITGAITSAIIGISLRTFQEGLGSEREIERYSDYRARTFHLSERFYNSTDQREKLHLMEEMELAAGEEMRSFMRTHQNATFLLA